jgi:hypothetical protein
VDRGQEQETEAQAELGRFLDDFVRSMDTWSSRDVGSTLGAGSSTRAAAVPDARAGGAAD